ncbi:hypothetical protein J6590_101748 [Homalodisca vitripennis]|nr:hypothetical protein J6590_101748 [Homalodisca vitripennis]
MIRHFDRFEASCKFESDYSNINCYAPSATVPHRVCLPGNSQAFQSEFLTLFQSFFTSLLIVCAFLPSLFFVNTAHRTSVSQNRTGLHQRRPLQTLRYIRAEHVLLIRQLPGVRIFISFFSLSLFLNFVFHTIFSVLMVCVYRTPSAPISLYTSVLSAMKMTLALSGWWMTQSISRGGTYRVALVNRYSTVTPAKSATKYN